jgi:anti-anti-sigma factor
MTLTTRVEEGRQLTKTLVLEGRLDHESVDAFDKELDAVLESPVKVVIFNLTGLEYITSAGLRSIFRAQKVMTARAGKVVILNPQPQVQKVLDIVKMPDLGAVFRSVRELDDYLDAMQRKVSGEG